MTHSTTAPTAAIGTRTWFLDTLERTAKTFVQNIVVFLTAGVSITSIAWPSVFSSAGLAALASFLLAAVSATAITSGNPALDIIDRMVRTGAGSILAAIPVVGGFGDVDWGKAVTIAAGAMVLSVVTSLGTLRLGSVTGFPTLAPVLSAIPVRTINPTGVTRFHN